MKAIRKLSVLAATAVSAMALVAPSVASADWLYEKQPIGNDATIGFKGSMDVWRFAGAAFTCPVEGEAQLIAGTDEGEVTKYTIGKNCTATSSHFSGCKVTSAETTPPYAMQGIVEGWPAEATIVVEDLSYTLKLVQDPGSGTACTTTSLFGIGDLTLEADDAEAMSSLTGWGHMKIGKNGNPPPNFTLALKAALNLTEPGIWGLG